MTKKILLTSIIALAVLSVGIPPIFATEHENENAVGLLVKESLISEEFQAANNFLTFDHVECTTNENGPQSCSANGTVDKGNFIAAINKFAPGAWGQIMRFLMQILGNPNFDMLLLDVLLEGVNEEFAANTGNTAFTNEPTTTKLTLEQTTINNNGDKTSQLNWTFYEEFQ